MKAIKSSRRFTSEKTARKFAKLVSGEFKDLRRYPDRKSNFKVTYIREVAKKAMHQQMLEETDPIDLELCGVSDFGLGIYEDIYGD